MSTVIDFVSWATLLTGSVFVAAGAFGLVRFPDVYSRMHAAGVTDTAGAGLILVGLMLQAGVALITVKLVLILGFLLFTGPVATHALAKAALHGHIEPLSFDDEGEGRHE